MNFSDVLFNIYKLHFDVKIKEIDLFIENDTFINHESGMLYCLIEPLVDLHPNLCVMFYSGASNIYDLYKMFTDNLKLVGKKNKFLNYKIFIFQYLGNHKSYAKIKGNFYENYLETFKIANDIINSMNFEKIIYIGCSLGTYGTIKYGTGIIGLLFPFNLYIESNCLVDDLNCNKILENTKHKTFFVIAGERDDISRKTINHLKTYDNFHIEWLDIDHQLYRNRNMITKQFIKFIIEANS